MWPNQRPNFNNNCNSRGPFPAAFPRSLQQNLVRFPDMMIYYNMGYRTPGPTINFDFRFPNTGGPRMNSNPRKRKAGGLPNNNVNFLQPGKRQRMDLPALNNVPPANPRTSDQKKDKKNKTKERKEPARSDEDLYQNLINFASTSNIFKSPLPKDEISNSTSVEETIELPSVEDTEMTKLVSHPFVVSADNEIKRIADLVTLPESRYSAILNRIIGDLNESVVFNGYANKWNCFGSYLYGLVSTDSDIDLYYECESQFDDDDRNKPTDIPMKMKKLLQRSAKFNNVVFIKAARVPLVRVNHRVFRKQLDISFSTKLGVWNSLLTKLFLSLNPNLKYLTLYLKEILKKYQTLGTGKITTHILFWLVAFFMQQKRLLPAVSDVRDAATTKNYDSGWDCSLPENYSFPARPVSLYSLLLEFFAFYKDFDFLKYVICPFLGRAFLLSDFEQMKLPEDKFGVYFQQLEDPEKTTFSRSAINLQDPTDLSFNLSKQVTIYYANRLRIICHSLSTSLPNSVAALGKINGLKQILPSQINFDRYLVHDLMQYANFVLHTRNKTVNVTNMLEVTRKLMELIFGFEKKKIVIDEDRAYRHFRDGKIFQDKASVIYFEYCSTANTRRNDFIRSIIGGMEEEFRVYLTCEVCTERELVRVFVQGESNFVKFLRSNSVRLFSFALDELIVPS